VFDIPINQDAPETDINPRLKIIRDSPFCSSVHACLKLQWIVNELIRLGTSPTGISATVFKVVVSIAEIDAAPEFDT
jgi:hypothetical protein